ncbi:MAG: hypothetical protein QNJ45_06030 [Ardenticatenaceae bacterium]|nr:hypothetical protein [Ardenticatenaceae bacterium]
MQEPIVLILLIIFTILTLPPYLMVFQAIFPVFDQQVQVILRRTPGRAFVIGLVNFIFWGSAIALFGALSDGGAQIFAIPSGLLLLGVILGLSVGLGAVSHIVGDAFWGDQNRARQGYWGAMAVTLGSLAPFVGWFLLFPIVAITGLGAAFMNLLGRFQPEKTVDD